MTTMVNELEKKDRLKERKEIESKDCWNAEALYPSLEKWEEDFQIWGRPNQTPHWPEVLKFKGTLSTNIHALKDLLSFSIEIDRHLSKLFTYAHMKHDEDLANHVYKEIHDKVISVYHDFRQELSWVEPEILAFSEETYKRYLKNDLLKDYRIYLEKLIRLKPHTLSEEKEELLARAEKAMQTSVRAFSAFNNADLKFPSVQNSHGQKLELSHGKFAVYLRDKDRKLREEAFKHLHQTFLGFENTTCELLTGHIQNHVFESRARNYSSCLEAALFPNQIQPQVYHSLIQTVRRHLPSLHRYMDLRKKLLKYDALHLYDMHVPLIQDIDWKLSYSEAENLVAESVAPLGTEYQKTLEAGLKKDRWVDRYENLRKRSGAYSTGCYDSMPYILMNFHGTFSDLMTLAHEAGHSMHSHFSCRHQPYQYSNYSIFVAEVASTFNEELMIHHLFSKGLGKKEKAFLINQQLDDIRATFFRQTMFAEFELKVHQWAENNIPLTPKLLKDEYRQLNLDYFGPNVYVDQEIDIEWSRIPHFYNNFYVYQYATGISAAHALFERVIQKKKDAKEHYLRFLSSGCSDYPLEILKQAGVDMCTPQPIEATIHYFDGLVNELAKVMSI